MTREKLRRHKANKKELRSVMQALDKLQGDLDAVEVVVGKVTKSMDNFPYIEEHMTVKMYDPERTALIEARIRKKEQRKAELEAEIQEVEAFIDNLPEGIDKRIFEEVYLNGLSQKKAGESIGYTQARVSQIIGKYLKDL